MQTMQEANFEQESSASYGAWLVCFSATLIFFYEFIQGNMFASLGHFLESDLHLNTTQLTWLSSIYYAANVIFLPFAGAILDRFSIRKTILVAMALCVISTFIFAAVNSYEVALVCRFVAGIGSGFCFLGPVRLASQWFPSRQMAFVTGVIVTMAMTGGLMAQYPLSLQIEQYGWRGALYHVAILGVLMFIVMVLFVRERAVNQKSSSKESILASFSSTYFNLSNFCAALYTSVMNMPVAVWGAFMGSMFLQERLHLTLTDASKVNGMLFIGAIFGGPVIGYISDKINQRVLPMRIGALLSLICLFVILYLPISYTQMLYLFFALGFFTSSQVISYALVAETNSPMVTATALSLISIFTQGGFMAYQLLYNYLAMSEGHHYMVDNAEHFTQSAHVAASLLMAFGFLIAMMLTFGLRNNKKA